MNPSAPVVAVEHGRIDERFLHGLKHAGHTGAMHTRPPETVFSVSFKISRPVMRDRFQAVVQSLRENILRLKGYIHFENGVPVC